MLPGKKIALDDMFPMVRRRLWLLVIPPVLTLFAALLYSSTVPNIYQSDMLIAIDPQRVPDAFVRSTVTLETDRRLDAITVQVLSRTNLERVIREKELYLEERQLLPMEDVVLKMREAINVNLEFPRPRWGAPLEPTSFHVKFTYPDPNMAAAVTHQLGTLFVEQNTSDRSSQAGATNRFLETQLTEARNRLEEQERRLEVFRQRHGNALPTQLQTNMQAIQNGQLQAQALVESIARDRDRKQMLERLYREAMNEPPAPTAAAAAPASPGQATPVTGSATEQLAAARANLAGLELRYKSDHPDVRRARRLIAELEPKAAAEAEKAAASGDTSPVTQTDPVRRDSLRQMLAEIESLDRQTAFKESEERRVRAEIAEYQRRIESVPGLESEWVALTRDYDTEQTAYKELLAKSTNAQVAANLETQDIGERFRIVDPAQVPVHPLPSMRMRYNAGGLALGLMLGLGLAALLEFRDKSFRSDADVLEVLSLPVLASVPRVESATERLRRRRRMVFLSAAGVVCLAGMGYVAWMLELWNSLI
jgi:polysaccharide chain length determinant protein (PEP-CTERM system associated)